MTRATVQRLAETFGLSLSEHSTGPERMCPEKQLCIALWYFANQEVYSLAFGNRLLSGRALGTAPSGGYVEGGQAPHNNPFICHAASATRGWIPTPF
ncbi:uncharacterized protein LOC127278538 isoform X2 [Leptopilina boulardi]|uniref:uncharacterized protein LOC127278538 isoform X2 n=1 Tax=Leptopilina boulardi TaxID=63433 RepID=UPI0021F66F56|nr:uncharacterized protein LOC127278538 isoform X2 [Leptopilina boulardi]